MRELLKMESWIYISAISLAFSIPGLLFSYYSVILFLSTFRYPRSLPEGPLPGDPSFLSILIATFNEKFVIANTLEAIKSLDYPRDKLLVVIADDSFDETVEVIDKKLLELNSLGIQSVVSRRKGRAGFKSGALNYVVPLLKGDYVLLLDADSTVSANVLKRGLSATSHDPRIGFVSFRVGHYNREQNLTTRLFALQLDQGDTVSKMGAYSIDAPYSFQGGFVLISTLVGPFQGLSWVVVTFVSALGLIFGLSAPSNSIFSSPIYIIIVTVPLVSFFASGIYALYIQKIMSPHNLALLPLLSYTSSCMTTAIMIGFLNGIRGKTGLFFRTPKHGLGRDGNTQYHRDIRIDRIAIAEGILATMALAMSIIVLLDGVWALALTLVGFGALTLKSMNLSRVSSIKSTPVSSFESKLYA